MKKKTDRPHSLFYVVIKMFFNPTNTIHLIDKCLDWAIIIY